MAEPAQKQNQRFETTEITGILFFLNHEWTRINTIKQLAEAERHANEKTLELLRSMDKLGETAVDAVDANSLDAVKLQNRSFMDMPKMNFSQNAENDLGLAQRDLQKIYNDAAKIADAFTKAGEERKKADTETQKVQEERILNVFKEVQSRITELDQQYKKERDDIFNKMQEYEKKSAETIEKLEKTAADSKTSNESYQKSAETSLKQISENTRTFKDWQKATI